MIRAFTPNDLDQVHEIHRQFFRDEFQMPEFMNFICAFVVEDEKGIITAGGVRTIAECILVTDKSRSPIDRIKALYQMLNASVFVTNNSGYDQMYAWSQNPKWTNRLKRNGFRSPQGESLILDL